MYKQLYFDECKSHEKTKGLRVRDSERIYALEDENAELMRML